MNEGERIHYQIVWIGTGEWSETERERERKKESEVLLIVSQEVRKEIASEHQTQI